MKFYIDTADISEIEEAHKRGWIDGVTTNPSLVAKTGRKMEDVIVEICKAVEGPVSAEVISTEAKDMFEEGLVLAKLHKNVVVKVPLTEDGLIAVKRFKAEGIKTNVTLVFSPLQALMAAKAGATMVSPFVGRLDDISTNGMDVVEQIRVIFGQYQYKTEILVASVRHPLHILRAAMVGAHTVTCPIKVLRQIVQHPLTDKGLAAFLKDAEKIPR